MQLAPATLSTITAILSAQGVNVNHEQLQAALAPLTGETPPSAALELQPGEEIVVYSECSAEFEHCATMQDALDFIKDDAADPWNEGNFRREASEYRIFVVRKELEVEMNMNPTVEWAK